MSQAFESRIIEPRDKNCILQAVVVPGSTSVGPAQSLPSPPQALVVSTPQGIGAGDIIPAAHEAEEHLMRGEPVLLYPPPHKARFL